MSIETQKHPHYVPAETYLHTCPPIVDKEQLHKMYPECYNGIGKFKNYEYCIKLEENAKPIVHPVRKIAVALRGEIEKF